MNIREWVLLLASGFIGLSFLVFVIQLLRYSSLYVKTTGTVRLVYQRKEDDVTQYQAYYVYRDISGREYEAALQSAPISRLSRKANKFPCFT